MKVSSMPVITVKTRILALDPAAKCGWAAWDGTQRVSGTWLLTNAADTHDGQRLSRLRTALEFAMRLYRPELIAAEDASFGAINRATQAAHNELRGVIRMVAAEQCAAPPVILFVPATIKVFACGSKFASKDQMIAACQRMLGVTPETDDEADALWVLELARRPDCWPPKARAKNRSGAGAKQKKLWR